MNVADYYRAREIRLMRQAMKYRYADYLEDWELAVAIAQMMAEKGEQEHLKRMLEGCFNRMYAYQPLANQNPF